eukprot:gene5206-5860_t
MTESYITDFVNCTQVQAPTALSIISATATAILGCVIAAGNFLVILSVIIDPHKELRTPFNFFVVNLAMADLLVGVITCPLSVATHCREAIGLKGDSIIYLRQALHFSNFASVSASVLNLAAMCIDRVIAVRHPMRYRLKISRWHHVLSSVMLWLAAFGLSAVYFKVGFLRMAMFMAVFVIFVTILIMTSTFLVLYLSIRRRNRNSLSYADPHAAAAVVVPLQRINGGRTRCNSNSSIATTSSLYNDSRDNDNETEFVSSNRQVNNSDADNNLPNISSDVGGTINVNYARDVNEDFPNNDNNYESDSKNTRGSETPGKQETKFGSNFDVPSQKSPYKVRRATVGERLTAPMYGVHLCVQQSTRTRREKSVKHHNRKSSDTQLHEHETSLKHDNDKCKVSDDDRENTVGCANSSRKLNEGVVEGGQFEVVEKSQTKVNKQELKKRCSFPIGEGSSQQNTKQHGLSIHDMDTTYAVTNQTSSEKSAGLNITQQDLACGIDHSSESNIGNETEGVKDGMIIPHCGMKSSVKGTFADISQITSGHREVHWQGRELSGSDTMTQRDGRKQSSISNDTENENADELVVMTTRKDDVFTSDTASEHASYDVSQEIRIHTPISQQQNRKLEMTLLIMLVLFLACFVPVCVMIGFLNTPNGTCELRHWLRDMQFLLALANSAVNPFIYAWRLPAFKKAIRLVVLHPCNNKIKP